MFGDHVRWKDVRVYSTGNRPVCGIFSCSLARSCVSSARCERVRGKDAQSQGWPQTTWTREWAFQEIDKILEHDYVWNEKFGCYVGQEEVALDEDEMQEGT